MTYGAAGGKAIDIDARSLNAARENLARWPGVTVEACSVYEIAERDVYDVVFSIGVIHHLENPALALARMTQATKLGGKVLIWVYGLENNEWIVRLFNPLRRALFSRLPVGLVHHLSLYPATALWIALRLGIGRIATSTCYVLFLRHLRSSSSTRCFLCKLLAACEVEALLADQD